MGSLCLIVLQRGPRYFDPPDSGWGACYNCGEEGHITVNCTLARRKKPCFVCGSLEHHAKQCTKVCGRKKLMGRFFIYYSLSSLVLLALFNNVLVKFCFSCPVGFQVAEQLNCL